MTLPFKYAWWRHNCCTWNCVHRLPSSDPPPPPATTLLLASIPFWGAVIPLFPGPTTPPPFPPFITPEFWWSCCRIWLGWGWFGALWLFGCGLWCPLCCIWCPLVDGGGIVMVLLLAGLLDGFWRPIWLGRWAICRGMFGRPCCCCGWWDWGWDKPWDCTDNIEGSSCWPFWSNWRWGDGDGVGGPMGICCGICWYSILRRINLSRSITNLKLLKSMSIHNTEHWDRHRMHFSNDFNRSA